MRISQLRKLLPWTFGLIFLFGGITEITSGNLVAGLFISIAGLLTIPETFFIINQFLNNKITSGLRIVVAVILFSFGIGIIPDTKSEVTPAETVTVKEEEILPDVESKDTNDEVLTNENLTDEDKNSETGLVTSIADGDTITVKVADSSMKIRLIGIDTPEINHQSEPVQCYGPEAKQALSDLILNKEVTLEKDVSDIDIYDRYLRYIWIGETMANEYMVRKGYAFSSEYPPDTKYQDRLDSAQNYAENNLIGLWSSETCSGDVYTGTYKDPKLSTPSQGNTQNVESVTDTTYNLAPAPVVKSPPAVDNTSDYTCNCSKTCSKMSSCKEAYFQLNNCGCSARDGDDDGVPCESICK